MRNDSTDSGGNCRAGHQRGLAEIVDQKELEIDLLARTIWGEARGEGTNGMRAVACVIMNRLKIAQKKNGFWWGDNLTEICRKPYQFSAWNNDDPNRSLMEKVDKNNAVFSAALRIARRAVYGDLPDETKGATHYHRIGITPIWTHKEKPVEVIGKHIFYRLED